MANYKASAVIDKQLLEQIGLDLQRKNDAYYIIFRIEIDTGMPLDEIPKLRICDINKNAITFSSIHKHQLRTEALTEETQQCIRQYCLNKKEGDLAFPSKADSTKPLSMKAFQAALKQSSEKLGCEPPMTSLSLKKTFIYNLYMRTHSTKKVYQITGVRSLQQLYTYLGIKEPPMRQDGQQRYSTSNPRDILMGEDIAAKTRRHVNSVIDVIQQRLTDGMASYGFCQEALTMLRSIENATARFEAISDNEKLTDSIHRKSGDAGR